MKRRFRGNLILLLLVFAVSAAFCLGRPTPQQRGPEAQDQAAEAHGGHQDPVAPVLLALLAILAAAKAGGELFERIGQPAVLGELVAGVVLGNLILVHQDWTFFEALRLESPVVPWASVVDSIARIGVILLLFEVGLESSVGEMRKVGLASLLVATAGVVAPFLLGYAASALFIKEVPPALTAMNPDFDLTNIHLFIGATLTATSVGITARVLKDLGKMHLPEAKIILGAAVIDDVLGLLILSIVGGVVSAAETGSGGLSPGALALVVGKSLGFLVLAIGVGLAAAPPLMKALARLHSEGVLIVAAVALCFGFAYLANLAGLAAIVGAFCAGLVLEEVHFRHFHEERTLGELLEPVTSLLVPVFFVVMGLRVHLESFGDLSVLGIAVALSVAAILGKQVCGLVVPGKGLNRLAIGLGMIPRGEVGLIFAAIGVSLNVIDAALFSAIVIMVILTTFATPPALKAALERRKT